MPWRICKIDMFWLKEESIVAYGACLVFGFWFLVFCSCFGTCVFLLFLPVFFVSVTCDILSSYTESLFGQVFPLLIIYTGIITYVWRILTYCVFVRLYNTVQLNSLIQVTTCVSILHFYIHIILASCNFNIAERRRANRPFLPTSQDIRYQAASWDPPSLREMRTEGRQFGGPDRLRLRSNPRADQWWLFSGAWRPVCNYILALALDLQLWIPLLQQCPCSRPRAPLPCNHGIYGRDAFSRTQLVDAWDISDVPAKPISRLVAMNQPSLLSVDVKISSPDSVVSAD